MELKDTWWVNPNQLDEDQKMVIAAPINQSSLVLGPPGSGKSNLLLLRADYLQKAGHPNSIILVFTKQLQEFMKAGVSNYSFSESKIVTSLSWFRAILLENDIDVEFSGDFQKDRNSLVEGVHSLIRKNKLSNLYEYILLDEAQDYLPEEIEIFNKLCKHIFAVADSKQKIYAGDDPVEIMNQIVDKTYLLKYHYRNGLQICKLADGISKQSDNYVSLVETSNYNETTAPSTVEVINNKTVEEQCNIILTRLQSQIMVYPNELIGIITPRKQELDEILDFFSKTSLYTDGLLQISDDGTPSLDYSKPIVITTMHSAKGLEFRALHIVAAEFVKKHPKQRNICFTGVTRAKTSLCVYHLGELPAYFEQALVNMQRPPSLPTIEDLFK